MPGADRILFHCDACGMRAKIPARFAAKRIRCPGCRAPAVVAGSPATTTRIRAAASRETASHEPAGVMPDLTPEPTSVLFHCRACEFRAQVPARSAGKRVRCPRCRREGAVTTAEESARLTAIARAQPNRGIDREAATVRVPSDRLERASDRVARVVAPTATATATVETKPASAAYALAELLDRVAPAPRANRAPHPNAAPPARPMPTRPVAPCQRAMATARPNPTDAATEQADDARLALEDEEPQAADDLPAERDDAPTSARTIASDDTPSGDDTANADDPSLQATGSEADVDDGADGGIRAAAEPTPPQPITSRRARRDRMPEESATSPWSPTPAPQPILIEVSAAAAAREAPAEPTARHAPPPRRTSARAPAARDEPVAEATDEHGSHGETFDEANDAATEDAATDALDEANDAATDDHAADTTDEDAQREQPTARRVTRRRTDDPPRRRLRGVVALIAIAGVIGWTQRDRFTTTASTTPQSTAMAHASAHAAASAEVAGTVVANDEVDVVCASTGTIAKLPVDIGDRVGAGDVVAVIDASAEEADLRKAEAQSAASLALLAQARQNLVATQRKAEADDANARAAVAAAESRLRDAKAKAERMDKMLAKRLCSDEEAQSAKEVAVQADADLAAARAHVDQVAADALTIEVRRQDVAIAEANAKGDEASVDAAQRRLAGTRLDAPIAGVVCARPARLGARLDSASPTPLMTIADVSRLFVSVRVPQSEIGRLAVGGAVEIRSPAFPGRVFAGRVDRIGVRGEDGDSGPLFAVRIEALGDALSSLKPAMDAEVAFTAGPEAAAVARTDVKLPR